VKIYPAHFYVARLLRCGTDSPWRTTSVGRTRRLAWLSKQRGPLLQM